VRDHLHRDPLHVLKLRTTAALYIRMHSELRHVGTVEPSIRTQRRRALAAVVQAEPGFTIAAVAALTLGIGSRAAGSPYRQDISKSSRFG